MTTGVDAAAPPNPVEDFDWDKLAAARIWLTHITRMPYLAHAVFALIAVPTAHTPYPFFSYAVDEQWRMYVHPDAIANESVPQIGAALYHEIGHVLRGHAFRARSAGIPDHQRKRWNIAGDLEINDDLLKIDYFKDELTESLWVFPHTYKLEDDEIAEFYYPLLPEQKDGPGSGAPMPGAPGDGSGSGTPSPGEAPSGEQGDAPGVRDCGSGADGQPRPWDKGDDPTIGGMNPAAADSIRMKTAKEVQAHVAAKGIGSVPGDLAIWAKDLLQPTVDWRSELRSFVRGGISFARGQVDYTFRRPGRRQGAVGDFMLPSMVRPIPTIKEVIDVSGSMDADDLQLAVSEGDAVIKSQGADETGVEVLVVDAAVQTIQTVTDIRQVKMTGRGGTDMSLGIRAAYEHGKRPNVIIVFTDGETGWPQEPYADCYVIACIINDESSFEALTPPSWIKAVYVPKGHAKKDKK